jgi:rod shape-determining protein MreD
MSLMDLSPIGREPMRLPTPARLLFGLLLLGIVLNLLPWGGALLRLRPDFLLIVLLYCAVYEPRDIGQAWGFFLGLLMDVADSVLLGEHAFVYVISIFIVQLLRVRVLQLRILEQALHIGAILFFAQFLTILLNFSLGREFGGWLMLLAPIIGALLWPVLDFVATLIRQRQSTRMQLNSK